MDIFYILLFLIACMSTQHWRIVELRQRMLYKDKIKYEKGSQNNKNSDNEKEKGKDEGIDEEKRDDNDDPPPSNVIKKENKKDGSNSIVAFGVGSLVRCDWSFRWEILVSIAYALLDLCVMIVTIPSIVMPTR